MSLSSESMRPRSAGITSVSTPCLREHWAATSVNAASFLLVRTRLKPPPANSNARAFPIPDEAPVIIAHRLMEYPDLDCRRQTHSLDPDSFSTHVSTPSPFRT